MGDRAQAASLEAIKKIVDLTQVSRHMETTITGDKAADPNDRLEPIARKMLVELQDKAPPKADWKWHELRLAEIMFTIAGTALVTDADVRNLSAHISQLRGQFIWVATHYDMGLAKEMLRKGTLTSDSQVGFLTAMKQQAEETKLQAELKKLRSGGKGNSKKGGHKNKKKDG